jgi:hypothetical protein
MFSTTKPTTLPPSGNIKITSITSANDPTPSKTKRQKLPHWGTSPTTDEIERPLKHSDSIVLTTGDDASMCFHVLGMKNVSDKRAGDGVGVTVKVVRGPTDNEGPPSPDLMGLTKTLKKFNGRMKYILSTADAQKNEEATFYKQSEAMNAAIVFWPVVQIGVIILAATGWITGVVGFFKKTKLI